MENVKRIVNLAALVTLLLMVMLPILNASFESKIQTIPEIEDPTPGYWETSEYMIGSVAVGIIFPESNGTIDPSTEDWTEAEEQQITDKINDALDWWASQNPDANVSFVTEFNYRVPTSYELITHDFSDPVLVHAYDEILTYLGCPGLDPPTQIRDYINGLRERFKTDWVFGIVIIDASNDPDGLWADGWGASAALGGPSLQVPVKNTGSLEWIVAHEMGHIFWATDEYNGKTDYSGYLNVPDVEGSGCLMQGIMFHCLSGKPQGLEGTWGQIGWRDSDGDGIQDIVDTFPRVYLNFPEISQARVNYTGVTEVTPYPNNNPYPKNPEGKRDVTINKIKSIEFSVDSGDWTPAIPTDGSFGDAIENFTFVTEELEIGQHFIEIKATNQWGNSDYANATVTIQEAIHDVAITSINPYRTVIGNNTSTNINITAANIGDYQETFNVTLYYNTTQIETQEVTLTTGQSTLTFEWTTPSMLGNYTIKAIASQVPGETEIEDNTLTFYPIQISIAGDINADGTVNILDISGAAVAFQTNLGDPKWNSNADVNEDTVINIVDISKIAIEYGKTI